MTECKRCGKNLIKGKDIYIKLKLYDQDGVDKKTFCMPCFMSKMFRTVGMSLAEDEVQDILEKTFNEEYDELTK